MGDTESQQFTWLKDEFYDDPEQLSQLLRQRAGSDKPTSLCFTTSTEHTSAEAATTSAEHNASPQQQQASVAQPVSARDFAVPARRATAQTRNVPALTKFNSAPTSTGLVMETEGAERMYQSFGENLMGDTQPDSQIYRQWTSGVFGIAHNGNGGDETADAAPTLNPVQEEDVDADTTTDGAGVAASSQEQHSTTITSPTVVHEDESETQLQSNVPFTSPLKFETPAMAGRKRNNQGDIISSATRTTTTPGTALTSAPFFPGGIINGATGNGMSLTQLFNATQAGTSPLVEGATEDAIFQRPSPNFTNVRISSPPPAMSSPIKVSRSDPVMRSSSEPRTEYVTMQQSQERRWRDVEEQEARVDLQDSWDEPSATQKQRDRRRAKERFDKEAAKTFAQVSAPSLSSPASRRKKKGTLLSVSKTPKFKTPAPSRISRRSAYDGPFDDSQPGVDGDILAGPAPAKQTDEFDDSPDELSQSIASSARPTPVKAKTRPDAKVQVPRTSSHPQRTLSGQSPRNTPPASPSTHLRRKSQGRIPGSPMRTRSSQPGGSFPPVTIMDSQPDAAADASSVPRPRSLLPSSPSTNQYSINQTILGSKTGYTSQGPPSSMPPMPPLSTPRKAGSASGEKDESGDDEDGEERVPSSPPIIDADEVVYDEHHYEEHDSAAEEEVQLGEHSGEEDMDIDAVPESEHDGSDEDVDLEEQHNVPNVKDDAERQSVADQEELSPAPSVEDEPSGSLRPEEQFGSAVDMIAKPRVQRQSTVPESDVMDDTQPSIFAQFAQNALPGKGESGVSETTGGSTALKQTNSTEHFQTAREEQSHSQSNKSSHNNSTDEVKSMVLEKTHYRSLNDIANQPQTQTTVGDIADVEMPRLSFVEDTAADIMSGSSPLRPTKRRKITYSANKRNSIRNLTPEDDSDEGLPSSPQSHSEHPQKVTPSSSIEQDAQGPLVTKNAKDEIAQPATSKGSTLARSTRSKSVKTGALKPVNKELLKKPSPKKPMARGRGIANPLSFPDITDSQQADVEMMDAGSLQKQTNGEDDDDPEPEAGDDEGTDPGESPTGDVMFPNRVFALWPGAGQGYHPATFAGFADYAQPKCNILFDSLDGDEDDAQRNAATLDRVHVRALDLRIGDVVKVNEKGLKTNHSIVGFKNKVMPGEQTGFVSTDRLGYLTVVLEPQKRASLANDHDEHAAIERPIELIYLTSNLWKLFSDRPFGPHGGLTSEDDTRTGTPVNGTPGPSTPSLLGKRRSGGPSLLNTKIRAGSVTSTRSGTGSAFRDMAFAITLTEDHGEKDDIVQRIQSNGGLILEDGFDTLFESVEVKEQPSSSNKGKKEKGKAKPKAKETRYSSELKLRNEYNQLRFVALITDSHSRRTKYIQALALNVPCLHHRWITDSIQISKALPFEKYLLPAGASDYLGGAVRSRTMNLHDPTERFADVLKGRNRLLQGQSVLLIMGTTKAQLERRKPYTFLTQALGGSLMDQCPDLAAAKTLLKKHNFDWIYVSQEDPIMEASEALFGRDNAEGQNIVVSNNGRRKSAGGKRKRDQIEENKLLVRETLVNGQKVKVASDEFVVQSLILGELFPRVKGQ